jgi:hypothetical protein
MCTCVLWCVCMYVCVGTVLVRYVKYIYPSCKQILILQQTLPISIAIFLFLRNSIYVKASGYFLGCKLFTGYSKVRGGIIMHTCAMYLCLIFYSTVFVCFARAKSLLENILVSVVIKKSSPSNQSYL